jgi:hypothetical protein
MGQSPIGPGAPPASTTPTTQPPSGSAGGAAMPPAAPEPQWTRLIEESWTLPPGGEAPQHCAELVLPEDMYVAAFRPIHPKGTHHTTLSVTPDPVPCSTSALFQGGIIYAAGIGTEELRMPEGVAMKLPAGQVLHLGLHLYNVSDQELTGVSGIEVVRVDPVPADKQAGLMLSGPVGFSLDEGRQTIMHDCAVTQAQTVFALFPHMHQLGVHLKTSVITGGTPRVLHDGEYLFEEQYQVAIEPHMLSAGDVIRTECTFQNDTGGPVGFGESSDTEMCFSVFFRYPATDRGFCLN